MGTDKTKKELSFLDHLEELRWHIIRSAIAIILVAILIFIFHEAVFDKIIIAPKNPAFLTNRLLCQLGQYLGINSLCINSEPFQLINITMSGQFTTHIMVSLIGGLVLAFPYVFYEFWKFVVPALYSNERKNARGAVFFSSVLFLTGILFGYYIIVPLSVHFLGSYHVSSEVFNQINLTSYISTVTSVTIASGVIFELPIVIFFLTKSGLVTPTFLRKYRKHSLVIILILSAIITPPDIFSQILVAMPLLLLYELSIVISKRVVKSKEKEEALAV